MEYMTFAVECVLHDLKKEEEKEQVAPLAEQAFDESGAQLDQGKANAKVKCYAETPLLDAKRLYAVHRVFRMMRRQERRRLRGRFR